MAMQQDATETHLLNCELDLESIRVRLSPYPTRIDQTHFVQAPNSLQTQAQQLLRLQRCCHPVVGRVEEAAARPAPRHHAVLRNVLRDVDEERNARRAKVLGVPYDWHAALAAQRCWGSAAVVWEGHVV
jgi:septation ring formation regulator EzrA